MAAVTVEYRTRVVHKQFASEDAAKDYLVRLKGDFLGYLDNGTFAIYGGPRTPVDKEIALYNSFTNLGQEP